MKSKRNQYLLLVLVLFVWGGVVWRFFSFTGDETSNFTAIEVGNKKDIKDSNSPTYRYHLNYRDPFLKNPTSFQNTKTIESAERTESRQPIPKSNLPKVEYLGLVKGGKKVTGIFRIDKRTVMCSVGQVYEGIEFVQISESKASVKFLDNNSTQEISM